MMTTSTIERLCGSAALPGLLLALTAATGPASRAGSARRRRRTPRARDSPRTARRSPDLPWSDDASWTGLPGRRPASRSPYISWLPGGPADDTCSGCTGSSISREELCMSPSRSRRSRAAALVVGAGLASAGLTACSTSVGTNQGASASTPIQHLVVIYQENVSFDHYFGSYPVAANSSGSRFSAAPDTPTANGLTGPLLTANPNGANPRRLDPATIGDVLTCDQDHNYTDEQ